MPRPKRSNLSRQSRNARVKRNVANERTEEEQKIAREESRVSMARLRASYSQEQRDAVRERARLAMRKRRANLRNQQLVHLRSTRRNSSNTDLNRAAFQYNYSTDYCLQSNVRIGPMGVCKYCGALKFSGEPPGLCCFSGMVKLPSLTTPPEPLHSFTLESQRFLANTQIYNSCYQMTSFGAGIIEEQGFNPTFEIDVKDGLPNGICTPCYNIMNQFYVFKILCNHSNSVLEVKFKNNIKITKTETVINESADIIVKTEIKQENDIEYENNEEDYINEGVNNEIDIEDVILKVEHPEKPKDGRKPKPIVTKKKVVVKTVKQHQCKQCPNTYSSKWKLRCHEVSHVSTSDYKCEICEKTFKCNRYLITHHKTHSSKVNFQCDYCKTWRRSKALLIRHINACHTIKCKYECKACSKSFNVKCDYDRHMETHKNPSIKCNLCSKLFKSSRYLKVHLKSHLKTSNFQCDYCQKYFKTKPSLRMHIISSHMTEKIYNCKHCMKQFNVKRYLFHHICEGEGLPNKRPDTYKCKFCPMIFNLRQGLVRHQETHKKTADIKCKYCDRRFKSARYLKSHYLSMHLDAPSFICDICNISKKTKAWLRRHIRMCHLDRFKCDYCPKSFNSRRYLNCHYNLNHSNRKATPAKTD